MRSVARLLPGILGAALICVGLGLVYMPLALVGAGCFLLLVDWRLS